MIPQLIMELEEDLQHQPFNLHYPQGEKEEECLYHDDEKEEDDDNTDTLSLCDLPLNDAVQEPTDTNSSSSYQDDLFEFFALPANSNSEITPADQVICCGKLVPYKQQPIKIAATTEKFQSERFPSRSKHSLKQHSPTMMASPTRHHHQQHGMKYSMIVLGFGKNIQTEMGLSDIRKRQSRLTPKPLVPLQNNGGKLVVAGNGFEKQEKGKWRLMRSLFGSRRSDYGISALLTRSSFNCLSVSVV